MKRFALSLLLLSLLAACAPSQATANQPTLQPAPIMKDGKSILEGASKLTLTIINVDATSRVFEWELN